MSKQKNIQIVALIAAILFFVLSGPYFFWQYSTNLLSRMIIQVAIVVIFYFYRKPLLKKEESLKTFFIVVAVLFLINAFVKGARLGVLAQVPYIFFYYVIFCKTDFCRKVINNYTTIYSVIIVISVIFWVGVFWGFSPQLGILDNTNPKLAEMGKNYTVYPMVVFPTLISDSIFRFYGPFDEPGVVGTIGALLLCINGFNFRDWRSYPMLISGILSFSLFFYLIVGVYWILNSVLVRKSYSTLFLVIALFGVFYIATKDNKVVSDLMWTRLEWNSETGTLAGNSRGMKEADVRLMGSNEFWFGVDDVGDYWSETFGSSSIFSAIAMYGFVFTLLYIIFFLKYGYGYRKKWAYFLYVLVVVGCMYQRPNVYSLLYILLFTCLARSEELATGPLKNKRTLNSITI